MLLSLRGYIERGRFQLKLSDHREQKRRWKLIENFSKLVQRGHEKGTLLTFDSSEDLSPEKREAGIIVTGEGRKLGKKL